MQLFGNNGNNELIGSEFDDQAHGGKGSDTLVGLEGNDFLKGGTYRDSLIGGAGNDTLFGGYDADTMLGGIGDDIYAVNDFLDRVIELDGEGIDTVFASTSYVMETGVERAFLTGNLGNALYGNDTANELFGNNGNNALLGQDGNDTLVGRDGDDLLDGGAGNDVLRGGLGSDVYYVTAGDVVYEHVGGADGGIDTIFADTSWSLVGNFNVEQLVIDTSLDATAIGNAADNSIITGIGNDDLYGGHGNDTLVGDEGNDLLDGGKGSDLMAGGTGNDTYIVNSALDVIVESAGEGNDTVKVWLDTYTLETALENLTLLGSSRAGNGNSLANLIHGSERNNLLHGFGGSDSVYGLDGNDTINGGFGNDLLDGGAGADRFVFDTTLNETTNVDTLQGFSAAEDVIALSRSVFAAISPDPQAPRTLSFQEFALNTVQTTETRIVYHEATGGLYYDADGTGSALAVKFAVLDAGLMLSPDSFVVT